MLQNGSLAVGRARLRHGPAQYAPPPVSPLLAFFCPPSQAAVPLHTRGEEEERRIRGFRTWVEERRGREEDEKKGGCGVGLRVGREERKRGEEGKRGNGAKVGVEREKRKSGEEEVKGEEKGRKQMKR